MLSRDFKNFNFLITVKLLSYLLFLPFSILLAEKNSETDLKLTGFADTYFAHDFNDPYTSTRPYTTQALYDNEARVNLAMLGAEFEQEDLRGKISLQAGDSVKSNYSAEQDQSWRYIQEANLGVKLTDKLWLDGGIYFAHVGFESFNSYQNWTYTRSLVAEFSPYYESGAKLTYAMSNELTVQLHLLNGWQNISSSAEPMYGIQLDYSPTEATQLIYGNILGEQEGSGFRNFHDFILRHDLTDAFSMALQFDFGTQEQDNDDSASWHGWAILGKYKINSKLAVGLRLERYYDPHQVIVTTLSGKNYNVTSLSTNLDYELLSNLLWRTEYRIFLGENAIFPESKENSFSDNDILITTALSYSFDLVSGQI